MNAKLVLPSLLLASATLAQGTPMPLPAFTTTFSSSVTRGFWFQAPVPMFITGLSVPDESGNGTQNVEVLLSTSPFAAYPASATTTTAFYAANQPSNTVIPCVVNIAAGEYVGILGACGTTTMHNSYGSQPFASTVLGMPVTLERLITQTNLNTSGGGQPVSTDTGGSSLGRIEVYAQAPFGNPASITPYGQGCGGYTIWASYHEEFGNNSFDLGGTPGNEIVIHNALNTGGGYTIVQERGNWFTPTTPDLGLLDDEVSAALPLGFAADVKPGVTVTDLYVSSNGFVWLAPNTDADYTPSAAEFFAQDPRIALFWSDLAPATGGGAGTIHFETDPANRTARVTFVGVQEYNNPGATITMQLELYGSGRFRVRYGTETMSTAGSASYTPIAGYTPGNGAIPRSPVDINRSFVLTSPDHMTSGMTLTSDRPVAGTTVNFTVDDLPEYGLPFGAIAISGTQYLPGVQSIPGLAPCFQYTDLQTVLYFFPGDNFIPHSVAVSIPAVLAGTTIYAQAVQLAINVNNLNAATSNGLHWDIGTF